MGGVRFFASRTVSLAKTSRSIVLSRSRSTFRDSSSSSGRFFLFSR